jgi:hypothetical protein
VNLYTEVEDHNAFFLSIGRSRNLLLWNMEEPPVDSVIDSSTATLVEVSVF